MVLSSVAENVIAHLAVGSTLYTSPVPLDSASKLTVETPEQIGIDFELAGLGSRLLAALIDLLCMLLFLFVAVAISVSGMGEPDSWKKIGENAASHRPWTQGLSAAATILLLLSVFVVQWGYYIICEMTMGGASPGKRSLGLRVIRDNGLPIGFSQSMLRNLVRIVDFLPWGYGVGLVAVFASRRSQRLGDLAAGTLVVKMASERVQPLGVMPVPASAPASPSANAALLPEEHDLVMRFIARRGHLLPEARQTLAGQIAEPIARRIGRPPGLDDEAWLDSLVRTPWVPR
jgi:uncharacterized RDD family membrane protein YckC